MRFRTVKVALAAVLAAVAISASSTAVHAATPAAASPPAALAASTDTRQPTAAETPLSFWRLEATFPYRNATEDHWALLYCQNAAGVAARQGALDFYCSRNVQHSRWELWVLWPDNCPGCRAVATTRS